MDQPELQYEHTEGPSCADLLVEVAEHIDDSLPLPRRIVIETLQTREVVGRIYYAGDDDYEPIAFIHG